MTKQATVKKRLTITMDETLVDEAKKLAEESGRSISQMLADYVEVATRLRKMRSKLDVAPEIRELRGILKGKKATREIYHEEAGRKVR